MVHILVETFGNRPALERAMKKANPDHTELMEEYERLETDLAKVVKGRDRILNLVANNDTITDEDAKKQLEKLKDREQQLQQRQETIAGQLGTKVDFKQLAEQVNGLFQKRMNKNRRGLGRNRAILKDTDLTPRVIAFNFRRG